jgi:hypothetical protein
MISHLPVHSEISVPGAIVILVVKAGECCVNVFKRHIMLFTPDTRAKVNGSALVKVKINNGSSA